MKTDNKSNKTIDLPQFISKLKKQDKLYTRVLMAMKILYIIIIIPHIAVIAKAIYNSTPYTEWIGYLGTLIPFLIIYFFLNKRHIEYKKVDYSQPTYSLLQNIEKRYKLLRLSDTWAFVALFILGISLGFDSPKEFLRFQLEYWAFMLIAFIIGYIWWYIKEKPMKDRAKQWIKELEE